MANLMASVVCIKFCIQSRHTQSHSNRLSVIDPVLNQLFMIAKILSESREHHFKNVKNSLQL
jgi:hypothetical protein